MDRRAGPRHHRAIPGATVPCWREPTRIVTPQQGQKGQIEYSDIIENYKVQSMANRVQQAHNSTEYKVQKRSTYSKVLHASRVLHGSLRYRCISEILDQCLPGVVSRRHLPPPGDSCRHLYHTRHPVQAKASSKGYYLGHQRHRVIGLSEL